jgi:hypothetical protein
MNRGDTALLVVDVQGKLVQLIPGHELLVWNIGRLIDGAKILRLPVLATEQYPKGLGPTSPELATKLENPPSWPLVAVNAAGCSKNWGKGDSPSWFAALKASACSKRCMTCWPRDFAFSRRCRRRSRRLDCESPAAMNSAERPSRPSKRPCSNGATWPARRSSSRSAIWSSSSLRPVMPASNVTPSCLLPEEALVQEQSPWAEQWGKLGDFDFLARLLHALAFSKFCQACLHVHRFRCGFWAAERA